MLSLGITKKWSEGWVEAASPPKEPWPILAQQALVVVLELAEVPTNELKNVLHDSFPELSCNDITTLVEHLIKKNFLDQSEGVVRVGLETERIYSRGHYRDLLVSFSGSSLLTGRNGSSEVGFIDPTVLSGKQENRLLLLAGRSWHVLEIDWTKRIVWLEPAREGGKARWMGGPRSLGRELCEAIRSVLEQGATPIVTLSQRAKDTLQSLKNELPIDANTQFLIDRTSTTRTRTWTFAGTRANRTWAHIASISSQKVRFDALSVDAPPTLLAENKPNQIKLTDDEINVFAESIKFSECIPSELLSRTIIARNFDN
jgi:ATP-dependent Lhr-like helicase